ncbi:Bromodomain-containing protein, partial [Ramicandelaber brevisporus]
MSAEDKKVCRAILRKLTNHRLAGPFLQPVDPVRDGCPTYFDIIKQPMDLETVRKRLAITKPGSGAYVRKEEFVGDVKLMLENCAKFNPVGTPVYMMGKALE